MGNFARQAASALRTVTRKGTPVTFSRTVNTVDLATGEITGTTVTTIAGQAVQVAGEHEVYATMGLVESANPTLIFTPTTYGAFPSTGDTCSWGSQTYTAKDVSPIRPDGTAILARVIVGR